MWVERVWCEDGFMMVREAKEYSTNKTLYRIQTYCTIYLTFQKHIQILVYIIYIMKFMLKKYCKTTAVKKFLVKKRFVIYLLYTAQIQCYAP